MRPVILIPSYNTGRLLETTVTQALAQWRDVCVVIDGSTDGSEKAVQAMQAAHPGLQMLQLPVNQGKGAAVLAGARAVADAGFTHALTMDADGQHPADWIPKFLELSRSHPEAVLMGKPIFGPEAPLVRVRGRQLSNLWAHVETLAWGIGDSLFGMRLYPLPALLEAFRGTRFARRFDFDTEVAVRLCWHAVPMLNVPTPVRYISAADGGVSQFRYLRDNALLTWMHARLMCGFFLRLPLLLWQWKRGGNPLKNAAITAR
ncbi:MAG: glycosyltransferase family 2 protein [Verrucomicrobiaceae bacterium]|nr:glycosyltransferase family 2 protein [Verrucomicrobiaceae bacterium]